MLAIFFCRYYQCDSGGAVNRKSSFWVSHSFKPYIEKLTLNVPSSLQEHQDTDDIRIRFNPVTCYAGNVSVFSKVLFLRVTHKYSSVNCNVCNQAPQQLSSHHVFIVILPGLK